MKFNFKITRARFLIGMIVIGIFLTFLSFYMFSETKIFNDYMDKDRYGSDLVYGWIHMALNTLLILVDVAWLICFLADVFSDNDSTYSKSLMYFLYKDDYENNNRRYSRNEEKDETPNKSINWKRWIWSAIIIILVLQIFKVGKVIYKQSVFVYNTSKKYQNTYQQKVEEKMGFYDKLWKTYLQKEKITNINQETFVLVTKIIMENRADGQNLTWKWLQENQQIPYEEFTKFYADLSIFIQSQREGYFNIEKVCQAIANQNNTLLDTFPNNIYNRMLKLPEIKFEYGFLSDSTNNVFKNKVENLQ